MRPSPPPPALGDFPSSPSSVWSCTRSLPTPPMDLHLDKMTGVQHSIPYPKSDSCFLSEDDIQVFLRNRGRWENMYNRFESSPPRNPPRVPPVSHDCATDDFPWEATHSAIIDPTELADPSRCSLLIHEVSLLVGLAPDDGYPSPDDSCFLVPDGSKQVPDILPLSLTPTKSLASRKHRNTRLPHPTDTNVQVHLSNIPIFPSINPHPDNPNPTLHNDKVPPVRATDLVTPPARHKSADTVRPSLPPRRRQGQVFHLEPPLSDAPHRNAVDLDETFFHPREPPPKPTPNSLANRCSSLDKLERSLLKLEAHAPRNHHKSQSEERSRHLVAQRKDRRPSLPPPRRLKKEQSSHEVMRRNASRPAHGCYPSDPPPPVPRPIPVRQHVAPLICPAVPPDEDLTPGSFMDMDIPCTEKISQKRHASFRQLTSKEKMKSLVRVAKTTSRGVIAWGKNLTGSTKPSVTGQETATVQNSRV